MLANFLERYKKPSKPNYAWLRHFTELHQAAHVQGHVISGYGNLEPLLELPIMRPPREVWGPLTDRANSTKATNAAPKIQGPSSGKNGKGAAGLKGAGSLKSSLTKLAGAILGRAPAPSQTGHGEEDESDDLFVMPIFQPRVSYAAGPSGGLGGKKPEPA